uniref:Uncharacterized protein n=1 Tax=Rhizophora mucronata TaxID=61149 RepID=A0A2P2P439_RHIMU
MALRALLILYHISLSFCLVFTSSFVEHHQYNPSHKNYPYLLLTLLPFLL